MPVELTPQKLGGEFLVNQSVASDQWYSFSLPISGGAFVALWSSVDPDNQGVYGRAFGVDGTALGDEFLLTDHVDFASSEIVAQSLASGGFVLSWVDYGADGSGDSIVAQVFDETGADTGAAFVVNSFTLNGQIYPSVLALDAGGFIVTWTSYTQDGDLGGVYAQAYDASANEVGGEFQINEETYSLQYSSNLTALSGGGFVATWNSLHQDGHDMGVFASVYAADGNLVTSEFQVNTATTGAQDAVETIALPSGGFAVVWRSNDYGAGKFSLVYNTFDATGSATGPETSLSVTLAGYKENGVIALEGGGFVVTWEEETGLDGDSYGIFAQAFDATGQTIGNSFSVNTTTAQEQYIYDATPLPDGGFVVIWTSEGQDGGGSGVFGQRFGADGSKLGDEFQINSATLNDQDTPQVTVLDNGNLVVTWDSTHISENGSDVYGQIFTLGGSSTSDEFTLEEEAELTDLWTAVTFISSSYKAFAETLAATYQEIGGTFENPSMLQMLQEADIWETFSIDVDGANNAALVDFLQAAGKLGTLEEFLEFSKSVELVFGISALDFFEVLPTVIEALDYVRIGVESVFTMIVENDPEAGYDALEDLMITLAGGGLATLTGAAGVTGTIGGILTTAGVGTVFATSGAVVIVGAGTFAIMNEINEAYDITGGLVDLYGTLLINIASGFPSLSWSTEPIILNGDHFIVGGRGNDVLTGNGENDVINGAAGDDIIDGGTGADKMFGGAGNDTYYVDHVGDQVKEYEWSFFWEDIDIVYASVSFSMGSNVDILYLQGSDDLSGKGNVEDNKIVGNSGDNKLEGGRGKDILWGGFGHDTLEGGKGKDHVYGNGGDDLFIATDDLTEDHYYGGRGVDTLKFEPVSINGIVINLGKAATSNGAWGVDHYYSIENVIGTDLSDHIIGDAKNNVLKGQNGADYLSGSFGNDDLYGGAKNDTLRGGRGADTFTGGSGRDTLFAGNDNARDVFVFKSVDDSKTGWKSDSIYEFDFRKDVLDISQIDADIHTAGNQAFSFSGSTEAESNAIWLIYKKGGDVFIRGDVDGDASADFQIKLEGLQGAFFSGDEFIL